MSKLSKGNQAFITIKFYENLLHCNKMFTIIIIYIKYFKGSFYLIILLQLLLIDVEYTKSSHEKVLDGILI